MARNTQHGTRPRLRVAWCVWAGCGWLAAAGCSTITPRQTAQERPSEDGNAADSGFKGFDAQGYGLLTDGAVARYNALAAAYGGRFAVALQPGHGLSPSGTPHVWRITKEALDEFKLMTHWRVEGVTPIKN